ncbi:hypothetical protein HanPSC8_Chr08g0333451 [Helianthus annuus]|nr:hypothetical protein HanPSC8_Chr08g0333451 [Helianthus annuus]
MTLRRTVSPFFTESLVVPWLEHRKRSPGCPLIVIASDTFGAAPLNNAWRRTLITFRSHHSPICIIDEQNDSVNQEINRRPKVS